MIPMTRDSRAASTTSLVTVLSWLMSMMRWICAISRVVSLEIAAGDADDRGAGLAGGEVFGVVEAEVGPLTRQYEGLFVAGQGLVVVQESDAAVELRVAGQSAFNAGHADEDQAGAGAVVVVA